MDLYIYGNYREKLLFINGHWGGSDFIVRDAGGNGFETPVLSSRQQPDGSWLHMLDASQLTFWSPEHPVLYTLEVPGLGNWRFGLCELESCGNRAIKVNGAATFFRGYIRGITAHDHPNLTGESDGAAFRHHIRQAKKYGFNLVRFHSTVPDEEFLRAADELGLFVHIEIGFVYRYDQDGKSGEVQLDDAKWSNTIIACRNHPSVAIFCIGNEMHRAGHQSEVRRLYRLGKALAPSKLIMDNSGWGEFDRSSADVFSQHIAYYFPFKQHRDMFVTDDCWRLNGSMYDSPLESTETAPDGAAVAVRRLANPIRPVLAHEAVHYIALVDYEALNAKFDAFAAKVGPDYLAAHNIVKPRFLTELPKLIRAKHLEADYADFRAASERFTMAAIKIYLERVRLSPLCGFEMLQFADCFKYENKNGIVDCFDDDKFIPAKWMLQFNGPTVLLADWPNECFNVGDSLRLPLWLSHFGTPANADGTLTLTVTAEGESKVIYRGEHIITVPGLQKLVDLTVEKLGAGPVVRRLEACFATSEFTVTNSWEFRVYQHAKIEYRPLDRLADREFAAALDRLTVPDAAENPAVVLCDRWNDALFKDLAAGRTVLLFYHRDAAGQTGFLPSVIERFKPCIWDRGSNLGGVIAANFLREALGGDRYFDLYMQPLLEGGCKLNFDRFQTPGDRLVRGVDKPVRDRMKGLVSGVKKFIAADTLRDFCHLAAWRVGAGKLVISTFATDKAGEPQVAAAFAAIINELPRMEPTAQTDPAALRDFAASAQPVPEDVMNHFWELDNKIVEDTLFWEETGIDLSKIK